MNTINIYGKPSYPYDFIKSSLKSLIAEAKLPIHLNEIQDVDSFVKDQIEHIPAIRYKGETKTFYDSNLHEFSNTLKDWILENENLGQMNKILVPIDYSPCSENALAYAKGLIEKKNHLITILHSFFPTPIVTDNRVYIDEGLENSKREKFSAYVEDINAEWIGNKSNGEIPMKSMFNIGFAGDIINSTSNDMKDGFIVMGSTGNSGIQKRIFGSISINVSKKAKCPVLIVPEKARFQGFKNVLYCCNDLSLDGNMVSNLTKFLRGNNSNIHLAHFGYEEEYDSEALIRIWNEFYDSNKIEYSNIEEEINQDRIKAFCRYKKIDLIVIARPKRGTIENFLHKSFTKEMNIFSETPLLILNQQ